MDSEIALRPTLTLGPIYAIPRDGLTLDELVPLVEAEGYRVIDIDRGNNRLHVERS